MSDYLTDVQLLEAELVQVERAFRGLADSDWRRPTLLQPPGGTLPPWTIFELAGHVDIAIGKTRMLIASQQDGQWAGTGSAFSSSPRSQVAPVFYVMFSPLKTAVAGGTFPRWGESRPLWWSAVRS